MTDPNLLIRLEDFLKADPERLLRVEFDPRGWLFVADPRVFKIALSKPLGSRTGALGRTLEEAIECILGGRP
jgi:hypothetical protein